MMKRQGKYDPKPLIEEHYHIQELIDRQEVRTEDRVRYQNIEKDNAERDKLINDTRVLDLLDFWCAECGEDIKAVGVLHVEEDWTNKAQRIALYKTKCFKGHWLARHVTDKGACPYWFRSRTVHRDRGKHSDDMVQPWQDGFNLLYGNKRNL